MRIRRMAYLLDLIPPNTTHHPIARVFDQGQELGAGRWELRLAWQLVIEPIEIVLLLPKGPFYVTLSF